MHKYTIWSGVFVVCLSEELVIVGKYMLQHVSTHIHGHCRHPTSKYCGVVVVVLTPFQRACMSTQTCLVRIVCFDMQHACIDWWVRSNNHHPYTSCCVLQSLVTIPHICQPHTASNPLPHPTHIRGRAYHFTHPILDNEIPANT